MLVSMPSLLIPSIVYVQMFPLCALVRFPSMTSSILFQDVCSRAGFINNNDDNNNDDDDVDDGKVASLYKVY